MEWPARQTSYLNGKLLKTHLGAYTAFGVDITDICEVGKENLLAVKVDNSSSLGEILPPVSGDFFYFWGYLSSGCSCNGRKKCIL